MKFHRLISAGSWRAFRVYPKLTFLVKHAAEMDQLTGTDDSGRAVFIDRRFFKIKAGANRVGGGRKTRRFSSKENRENVRRFEVGKFSLRMENFSWRRFLFFFCFFGNFRDKPIKIIDQTDIGPDGLDPREQQK